MTKKCAMAWGNLHITPDGKVAPCMQYTFSDDKEYELYNIKDHTLEEAINSPGMCTVRRTMLNEQQNDMCSVCDYREKNGVNSTRISINEQMWHRIDTTPTRQDGYLQLDDFKPLLLDVRFSNVCNLKCRMCSHDYSSAWYDESIEISSADKNFVFKSVTKNDSKFHGNVSYDDIAPMLDYVETIYFAGGEPLMTPDHYKVLEHLINNNRAKDVKLVYSTNLTISRYKGKPVRDYWAEFENVEVAASIDGMGKVGEYIRTNLNWQSAINTYNELKPNDERYSNISIYACITLSNLNVFHLPDFIKWCLQSGWILKETNVYAINYVEFPFDMSVKALPLEARTAVISKYKKLINWMEENDAHNGIDQINNIIKYIQGTDKTESEISELNTLLRQRLDLYDKTANLNWKESLNELEEYLR